VLLCDLGYTGRYCHTCSSAYYRSSATAGDGLPPASISGPTHQTGLTCSLCPLAPVGSTSSAGNLDGLVAACGEEACCLQRISPPRRLASADGLAG
jgi:hypothetical protein